MSTRTRALLGGLLLAVLLLAAWIAFRPSGERVYRVGSKKFTESVILGDVLQLLLLSEGFPAEHEAELGGTRIVFDALRSGGIDAYVEYTGTIQSEILGSKLALDREAMAAALAERGVRLGPALGFNNTYAIGMRRDRAEALGIRRLSDLRDHPDLRMGFTHEFRERDDGWRGLKRRYGLAQRDVSGLDHDIAYQAVANGEVDAIDVYSTDAKILKHDLLTLEDDLGYFPVYDAVILYRSALESTPDVVATLALLEGRLDERRMMGLNAGVDLDARSESSLAASFLEEDLGRYVTAEEETWQGRLLKRTREHLFLVGVSLAIAIVLGITLGVVAAKSPRFGQVLIGFVGAAQTIPGLALLSLLVPLLGIGAGSTIVALVIYSLLPIVRNTHAGITGIPRPLRESALVLGLPEGMRLTQVELPLAAPSIFAGIKTAAVWNVGLATIGALIGAGGYGQSIMSGLRRADTGLILEGAIPAIALALLVQVLFDVAERVIVSPGLRATPHRKAA